MTWKGAAKLLEDRDMYVMYIQRKITKVQKLAQTYSDVKWTTLT